MSGAIHICIAPTVTIEHEGKKYDFELTYMEPFLLDAKGNPRINAWGGLPKAVQEKVIAAHRERYPRKP